MLWYIAGCGHLPMYGYPLQGSGRGRMGVVHGSIGCGVMVMMRFHIIGVMVSVELHSLTWFAADNGSWPAA